MCICYTVEKYINKSLCVFFFVFFFFAVRGTEWLTRYIVHISHVCVLPIPFRVYEIHQYQLRESYAYGRGQWAYMRNIGKRGSVMDRERERRRRRREQANALHSLLLTHMIADCLILSQSGYSMVYVICRCRVCTTKFIINYEVNWVGIYIVCAVQYAHWRSYACVLVSFNAFALQSTSYVGHCSFVVFCIVFRAWLLLFVQHHHHQKHKRQADIFSRSQSLCPSMCVLVCCIYLNFITIAALLLWIHRNT